MRKVSWVRSIDRHVGIFIVHALWLVKWLQPACYAETGKVLVLKFAGMGDIILLKPVIDCIKKRSNSSLHLLTSPSMREVVEHLGLASDGSVYEVDFGKCISNPGELLALVMRLRRERFLAAIDFEQWMRVSAIISFLSGAALRYGFSTPMQHRHALYTNFVTYSFEQHTLTSFACLASQFLGSNIVSEAHANFFGCVSPRRDKVEVVHHRLLSSGWRGFAQPVAIIHPGCGFGGEPRMWLIEGYAEVARRLSGCGFFVVLTGGKDDARFGERLVRLAGCNGVLNLIGKTSFAELVALVSMAKFVVCPNTGIMHLAAAVGTPTVALHGPTNPAQWRPLGRVHRVIQARLDCVPCLRLGHDYRCNDYQCMRTITVEEVWNAIDELLKSIGM
ncbi:MAG: glycosyltransferase family 9 protein [Armatimonadota bacterium]|nr:glycosyltransferase family 9 protein [Armatimonadota bacterium]MCX7776519.1 glycosyltransferase family 9 protein [Armatimonadota bacterium]MDW8024316.1 glycosyltransferase family 9 protein [Armatimonadota bacterium]